jgi:hypothetical protein
MFIDLWFYKFVQLLRSGMFDSTYSSQETLRSYGAAIRIPCAVYKHPAPLELVRPLFLASVILQYLKDLAKRR